MRATTAKERAEHLELAAAWRRLALFAEERENRFHLIKSGG
ncbi:MAG TPA: hypothetical protein VGS12_11245 [Caulobacteraceae bacterium]|nr:hypothetical protein [Caulobacteraceae bacterium]